MPKKEGSRLGTINVLFVESQRSKGRGGGKSFIAEKASHRGKKKEGRVDERLGNPLVSTESDLNRVFLAFSDRLWGPGDNNFANRSTQKELA